MISAPRIFYCKIREDKDEHEYIVNTQRVLNYITCQEFKGFNLSEFQENEQIEYQGKTYPNDTPDNSFFYRNFMSMFMKNTQIECQH
jgi:hypothetical protein